MKFERDVLSCISALRESAIKHDIYIDDIIAESAFAGAFARRPKIETPANEPVVIDAEIVEPDAQDVQARVRGKGGIKPTCGQQESEGCGDSSESSKQQPEYARKPSSKTKVKEEPSPSEVTPAASPAQTAVSAAAPPGDFLPLSDEDVDEYVKKLGGKK
jgi:hypothetical protein